MNEPSEDLGAWEPPRLAMGWWRLILIPFTIGTLFGHASRLDNIYFTIAASAVVCFYVLVVRENLAQEESRLHHVRRLMGLDV